MHILYNF